MIGVDAPARPLTEGDADRVARMLGRLSSQSLRRRFFSPNRTLSESLIRALTTVDHDQHEALVIEVGGEIVALASYHRSVTEPDTADLAILVEDGWQHHGLGRRLTRDISKLAATRGIHRLHVDVLIDNPAAMAMIRRANQKERTGWHGDVVSYDLPLLAA